MAIDSRVTLPPDFGLINTVTNSLGGPAREKRPAPGRGPELLAQLTAAAGVLDEVPGVLGQLGDQDLTGLLRVLMRLQARAGQVACISAADAADRGTVDQSDAANTTQWVTRCATDAGVSIEPAEATMIAAVAEACRDRRNHVIATAVSEGSCTLATARTALGQTKKVAAVIPTASREEIQGWFLQLDPSMGSRGVHQLTRRLLAIYAPDTLSAEDADLEAAESLTWSTLPTGMLRLIADLSPANAAILKEAIGALSAPLPAQPAAEPPESGHTNARRTDTTSCEADSGPAETADVAAGTGALGGTVADAGLAESTGEAADAAPGAGHGGRGESFGLGTDATQGQVRDERTPGKRRVDALLELVAAGARMATGDGAQVGSAATLLVTLGLEALTEGVGGATTPAGDVLDAGAARRLACDADLIPIVLGGPSEPLDVGRRDRLVTKGMRAAVLARDRGCTFPGCDRPPGFCEVHHLIPWWAGGRTSLANSAMLCRRHHQTVHRQGYLATVTTAGVIWDLTPGRMPEWQREGYAA